MSSYSRINVLLLSAIVAFGVLFGLVANVSADVNDTSLPLIDQYGGATETVVISGTTVFVGVGSRVMAYDVSDIANPVLLGRSGILLAEVTKLALTNNALFALAGNDVTIFSPHVQIGLNQLGQYTAPGQTARDISAEGSTLYVAEVGSSSLLDDSGGIRIVDVSNPASPSQVGHFDPTTATDGYEGFSSVAANNAYLYATSTNGLVKYVTIDATDPVNPVVVSEPAFSAFPPSITNDYLYLASEFNGDAFVGVYSLANPAGTFLNGIGETFFNFNTLHAEDDLLFISSQVSNITIYDVSEPMTPVQKINNYQPTGTFNRPVDFARNGNTLVSALASEGFQLIDITDPSNPAEQPSISTATKSSYLAAKDNYLFSGNSDKHYVTVFDTSLSTPLQPIAEIPQVAVANLRVEGDFLYGGYYNLNIYDATDPTNITHLSTFDKPDLTVNYIEPAGNLVWLISRAVPTPELVAVDVSNPLTPTERGSIATSGFGWDVAIDTTTDRAYLGTTSGLYVYDISAPTPVEITHIPVITPTVN
ncbi:MAG TPA: hypothetical protein ENJ56_02960, partial [Anaerolineae bacterium]|nr:hypothetical protein [Anaerolineae bacterium]